MAYSQQIEWPDAQNNNTNLVEINLSLEAQAYLAYSHKLYNRDRLLKKLKRANSHNTKLKYKKSFFICSQAYELAKSVLHKLQNNERVYLNTKYISQITGCDSTDQNKRIMDQLDNFFLIKYHRLEVVDGTPYNYHYCFELHPTIIEELRDAELWNLKTMPAQLRVSYNNIPKASIRSCRSMESKISENSNFNSSHETSSYDIKKESFESQNATKAIVKQIQVKSFRRPNIRKKATNAHKKAQVLKFQRYTKPKKLADMVPLIDDAVCNELRAKCGRDFTNNFIRQRTISMGNKTQLDDVSFNYRAGYIGYMSDALRYELHDAVKTSGENFTIVANLTAEDKLWQQREKYLEETEQIAIRQPCPEHQFRGKLVGTLELQTAYNLLLAMQSTSEAGNALVLHLNRPVELTQRQKQVVIAQAQAVFNSGSLENERVIERVEFVVNQKIPKSGQSEQITETSQFPVSLPVGLRENPKLQQGKWGKVCSEFIDNQEHGDSHYQNWLAGLDITEDVESGTIQLRTSSGMVKDRIEQNYLPFLRKVAARFGVNKVWFSK